MNWLYILTQNQKVTLPWPLTNYLQSRLLLVKDWLYLIYNVFTIQPMFYSFLKTREALEVFEDWMLTRDRVLPTKFTYRIIISVCGRAGYLDKAFELFKQVMCFPHVAFSISVASVLVRPLAILPFLIFFSNHSLSFFAKQKNCLLFAFFFFTNK